MHKGVILLTKASDKDEAIENVNTFLEGYGDGRVWDWYVIGGRWSGTLNPKSSEFFLKSEAHFKKTYPEMGEFLSTKMVQEQAEALKNIWEEIGGEGLNPYARNAYDNDGDDDDALPLSNCVRVVTEWTKDMNAEAETFWEKMLESKKPESEHDMSAYYANRYAECKYDEFSFESNVYDIDEQTNDPKDALENVDQYFAVMVDMHN
jgi:hypothetical protein